MANADFWEQNNNSTELVKDLKELKEVCNTWKQVRKDLSSLLELADLVEETDIESVEEVKKEVRELSRKVQKFELKRLLSGKHDKKNAILTIHSGAGGTEACDWVEMLYRMYKKWIEDKGYDLQTLDVVPGDEVGIKSITSIVKGNYAFGYLKAERGVHRLVRISPFDADKRRHTSFASVNVTPEIKDDVEIELNDSDLRIDTFHASGPGGQHVNTADSAVRITHIPSGIVVQSQNERSQHKNKRMALRVLKSKLYELEEEKRKEEIRKERGEKKEIEWGNQIRSYIFHPYNMVKDHRTNIETGNVEAVMDGEIGEFIEEYLRTQLTSSG